MTATRYSSPRETTEHTSGKQPRTLSKTTATVFMIAGGVGIAFGALGFSDYATNDPVTVEVSTKVLDSQLQGDKVAALVSVEGSQVWVTAAEKGQPFPDTITVYKYEDGSWSTEKTETSARFPVPVRAGLLLLNTAIFTIGGVSLARQSRKNKTVERQLGTWQ